MRLARIKGGGAEGAVYHCISRTVGGQMLLDDLCKARLVALLMPLARFCGLEVITYCMMGNHFHLLVRVPETVPLSDEDLLRRAEGFYGPQGFLVVLARDAMQGAGTGRMPVHIRQTLLGRMGDVSVFMKEFKQRFSRWYNRRTDRFGTLWAERFKSVLVEDSPEALRTVAAYIDLNPVRAGLVRDPKDYRFCGYAAALVGQKDLQQGIMRVFSGPSWDQAAARYRESMFVQAGVGGPSSKRELDRESIRSVLLQGGKLSEAEILRLRVRHLTDGVALGSREFVDAVFSRYRSLFGPRRRDGARPIRGAPWVHLSTLRDLRVDALG
jgi:REP element-mobilizing transposase RayT